MNLFAAQVAGGVAGLLGLPFLVIQTGACYLDSSRSARTMRAHTLFVMIYIGSFPVGLICGSMLGPHLLCKKDVA